MDNLRFRLTAISNIFMGCNPAASGHGLIRDQYFSFVPGIDDQIHDLSLRELGHKIVVVLFGISLQIAECRSMLKKLHERAAWLYDISRQSIHIDVALVIHGDLFL